MKFDVKISFDSSRYFFPRITVAFNHATPAQYPQARLMGLDRHQKRRWGASVQSDLAGALTRLKVGGQMTEDYRIDRMMVLTDGYENNGSGPEDRSFAMFMSAEYLADETAEFTDLLKLAHLGMSTQIEEDQALEIHVFKVISTDGDEQELQLLACSNALVREEAAVMRETASLDADLHKLMGGEHE